MPMVNTNEAGIISICTGGAIFMLGVIAMFDKALMIAGNFLIIAGTIMLLRSRSLSLLEFDKIMGTIMFALGIVSLSLRLMMLGFLLELIGLIYIFKKSAPSFKAVLFRLMYGKILKTG